MTFLAAHIGEHQFIAGGNTGRYAGGAALGVDGVLQLGRIGKACCTAGADDFDTVEVQRLCQLQAADGHPNFVARSGSDTHRRTVVNPLGQVAGLQGFTGDRVDRSQRYAIETDRAGVNAALYASRNTRTGKQIGCDGGGADLALRVKKCLRLNAGACAVKNAHALVATQAGAVEVVLAVSGAGTGALRRRDDQLLLCFVQGLAKQVPAVPGNHLQLLTGVSAVKVDGHIRQAGRNTGHSGDRTAGVKHQRTCSAGVRIVEQHGRNIAGACHGAGLVADAGVCTAGVF